MTEFSFDPHGLVLKANIDGTRIFGHGSQTPTLQVPLVFNFIRSIPVFEYEIGTLTAEFYLNAPREPVAFSLPQIVGMAAKSATQVQLTVPIQIACAHWIETLRPPGEGVSLFVNLRLSIRTLQPDGKQANVQLHRYVSEVCQTQQGVVEIPREIWTRFLEAIGYGKLCVVEFPAAPLEQCQPLKNAYAALQNAVRLHREGFHTQAVGQCRVALDKFWEGRNPKELVPDWSSKLGKVGYQWLNEALTIIRHETNDPHHTADHPVDPSFSMFDSQMFIALTTAFVAYAARAGVAEKN